MLGLIYHTQIPTIYLLVNFNIPLTQLYILLVYIYNVKQKQTDMKNLNVKIENIIGFLFFAFILVLVGSLVYAAISGRVDLNNW